MFIYAGKTFTARYDRKAPIHIAVLDPESENGARSLCSGMVIAPINKGGTIDVTCRACQTEAQKLVTSVAA
jgi:tripartite-type tricarboxylate transporter receptor subunit TctC